MKTMHFLPAAAARLAALLVGGSVLTVSAPTFAQDEPPAWTPAAQQSSAPAPDAEAPQPKVSPYARVNVQRQIKAPGASRNPPTVANRTPHKGGANGRRKT
jgi:hypothetical protein